MGKIWEIDVKNFTKIQTIVVKREQNSEEIKWITSFVSWLRFWARENFVRISLILRKTKKYSEIKFNDF